MKQDRRRYGTSLLLVALGAAFLWSPPADAQSDLVGETLEFRSPSSPSDVLFPVGVRLGIPRFPSGIDLRFTIIDSSVAALVITSNNPF